MRHVGNATPTLPESVLELLSDGERVVEVLCILSMVQVKTSQEVAFGEVLQVISAEIFSAASSRSSGYLYGKPYCARMVFISTSLLPAFPSTSTTSPIMLW